MKNDFNKNNHAIEYLIFGIIAIISATAMFIYALLKGDIFAILGDIVFAFLLAVIGFISFIMGYMFKTGKREIHFRKKKRKNSEINNDK